jgi:DNA invertase Pin-like site-specific DNA recombinase
MTAAFYARKSTEQNGVADEQKSVARQVKHARQYAQRKSWIVANEHVYIDDGVRGAEFANRPGFLRLMNALKRAPCSKSSSCPRNRASAAKRSRPRTPSNSL